MRTLVLWPPQIPSYFNAGHHIGVFCVAAHLRRDGHTVDAIDAGVLNYSWKELADRLCQGRYQLIAVANDFDAVDGLARTIRYIRQLCPDAKVATFGRLSNSVPEFFHQYDLDAVVATGDYEAGISAWAAGRAGQLPGVWVRDGGGWIAPSGPGRFLDAGDWAMPDISEIPYAAYEGLYRDDANKFCGIPQRRELVVPVARGCPIGCSYCEVPGLQGRRDRRLAVPDVLRYIRSCFAAMAFEYVAFYAPTFTLDRRWMVELCQALIAQPQRYPWKCATTVGHLDEELVALMGRSGCVRVSVGLETLDPSGHPALPRIKQIGEQRFAQLASWCHDAGIELNAFVIVGLPGTDAASARLTAEFVRSCGARFRPTMWTPLEDLAADMSPQTVANYNRHTIFGDYPPQELAALNDIVFGPEPAPTQVMQRIPARVKAATA